MLKIFNKICRNISVFVKIDTFYEDLLTFLTTFATNVTIIIMVTMVTDVM